MAVGNYLRVNCTLNVKREVKGDYIYLTANGVTVRTLLKDWVRNTLSAKIAF